MWLFCFDELSISEAFSGGVPGERKITVSVRDCEHRLKTVSNLDEDKMISLLNFSRYYDKLELPIPRNRDKVLKDFSNAGAPLVAIERIVDSVPVSRNEKLRF